MNGLLREGIYRPGHFTRMLTVVLKLLNIVKPHRAYFGEKDYQQYELIKGMKEAFFIDVEIGVLHRTGQIFSRLTFKPLFVSYTEEKLISKL